MRRRVTLLLAVIAIVGIAPPTSAEPWRLVEDDLHYEGFFAGFYLELAVFGGASVAHDCEGDLGPSPLWDCESTERPIGVRSRPADAYFAIEVAPDFWDRVPDRDSCLRWHAPYVD